MRDPVIRPQTTRVLEVPRTDAATRSGPAGSPAPAHDDIARRAYDIYVKGGSQEGRCQQNWLQAERELRKHTVTAGPAVQAVQAPPATQATQAAPAGTPAPGPAARPSVLRPSALETAASRDVRGDRILHRVE